MAAEIKPVSSSKKVKQLRPFALCAEEFVVPDDFNEPLPEEILNQSDSPIFGMSGRGKPEAWGFSLGS